MEKCSGEVIRLGIPSREFSDTNAPEVTTMQTQQTNFSILSLKKKNKTVILHCTSFLFANHTEIIHAHLIYVLLKFRGMYEYTNTSMLCPSMIFFVELEFLISKYTGLH